MAPEILSAAMWIGGLVCRAAVCGAVLCRAAVSRAARTVLEDPAQVAFLRAVGRRDAIVGTGSPLVAIKTGLAVTGPPPPRSAAIDTAAAFAGLLVLAR